MQNIRLPEDILEAKLQKIMQNIKFSEEWIETAIELKKSKIRFDESVLKAALQFKISKHSLCSSCLKLRCSEEMTIEDIFNSKGYNQTDPPMFQIINYGILDALEQNGGCSNCKGLLKRVIQSFNNCQF